VADLDRLADDQLAGATFFRAASPSFTLRMSALSVQVKSRPGVTLRRW
jgi:hypothetical protein